MIIVTNTSDKVESFVISTCDFTLDDKGNTALDHAKLQGAAKLIDLLEVK